MRYVDGKPHSIDTVVVSSQHAADIDIRTLLEPDVREHVIEPEVAKLDGARSGLSAAEGGTIGGECR